ncbi:MAG: Rrf2 family transcriptional regulator [Clostridia bacterium]|nr:Rrf2 family transcriptional regulator [Clostridia bacterium]
MKISTRGRYALEVLCELSKDEFKPLKEITKELGLSRKYLESIMTTLTKSGLLESAYGSKGGYKLARETDKITIAEVLKATEGSLSVTPCLEKGANFCEKSEYCKTLPMWKKLNKLIEDYFSDITISDLKSN